MGVSIKDVAKRAGVSVKTVSNVVNDYEHVTDGTRARVRRAIEELNYRPNVSARNLRRARSGIIALAVPELDEGYFSELARLVIAAAGAESWTVLVDQTTGSREREALVTEGIRTQLIDGLIFSPLATGREDLQNRRDRTPLVLLGERIFDGPADHVAVDNVAAARAATEHLLELGRRRVAAIGRKSEAVVPATGRLRLEGYRQALAAAGLAYDDRLAATAERYGRADGARAMAALLELDDPPDAVFCFTDLLALGALRTLLERGVRVPEDVALIGFDDIEDGRFSTPTLSTVSPAKEQIARLAVEFLLSRIAGGADIPPREVTADHTLLARESTLGRHR